MTTYPLPTLACTVDANGISAPSLADILASLQASYQSIYGSDVEFEESTQDGQWLGIQAQAIYDANLASIAVFNQFSPATAVGTGLSSVVKINGIARETASNSSAVVTVVGQAGTTITNGIVGDNQSLGTRWDLPASVIIPPGGEIDVTATSQVAGAVTAAINTLVVILSPTAGWQTVTNAADAAVGAPVETDSQLRARQARSTEIPAQTTLSMTLGDLANLPGVTAVTAVENDTGATDGNGIPGHTVAFVVEGGDAQEIADTIGANKSIGCGTFGSTTEVYTDPFGIPHEINFSVPTHKRILISITLHALAGYSTAVSNEIKQSIADYGNLLGIGVDVLITRLYAPALLSWSGFTPATPGDRDAYELVTLEAAISPDSPGTTDLEIEFDEISRWATTDVTISVV